MFWHLLNFWFSNTFSNRCSSVCHRKSKNCILESLVLKLETVKVIFVITTTRVIYYCTLYIFKLSVVFLAVCLDLSCLLDSMKISCISKPRACMRTFFFMFCKPLYFFMLLNHCFIGFTLCVVVQ